jgi:hypothetical protein
MIRDNLTGMHKKALPVSNINIAASQIVEVIKESRRLGLPRTCHFIISLQINMFLCQKVPKHERLAPPLI